ncbi:MAG: hypothetical protein IJU44_03830 [Kiritimatiellae bacterium]|nr:hypothetical protein [Kiritimatiellia bacterium]
MNNGKDHPENCELPSGMPADYPRAYIYVNSSRGWDSPWEVWVGAVLVLAILLLLAFAPFVSDWLDSLIERIALPR